VALEFAPSDPITGMKKRPLLVSSGGEDRAAGRTEWQSLLLLLLALAGAAAVPAAWHAIRTAGDEATLTAAPGIVDAAGGRMVVATLLVLATLPFLYVVRLYNNRLVAARNRAQAAWALIDVHLRKRHDLLPDLVSVVEAALAHERAVQEAVAALRAGAASPPASRDLPDEHALEQAEAVDDTDHGRTRSLLALAEAYPVLRTDENVTALFRELTTVEDGVAFARTFYNDAVTVMRDRRQQFPGMLLAPLVPVPTMELFQPDLPEARPAETSTAPDDLGRQQIGS
jgi:LemA protein